jgi:hypothetical protein
MLKSLGYICVGFVTAFCMFAIIPSADAKTFHGRVIDAETREPIEGAAVVIYWYEARSAPIDGWSTRLKDVKETLTDKNGEWSLTGPAGGEETLSYFFAVISFGITYYTREPEFIIFKPGYCSWPGGFSIDACRERINITGVEDKRVGKGGTLELPRVSGVDRIRNTPGPLVGEKVPFENEKEFIRLINEERRYLGLGEYRYLTDGEKIK